MDEMLRTDLDAPPKQRHTAHRTWERLVDQHGATIAYRTASKYVATPAPGDPCNQIEQAATAAVAQPDHDLQP